VFDVELIAEDQAQRRHGAGRSEGALRRQRSEQYLTSSQTFSHFLRQVNGKPHRMHGLLGRSDFLRIFIWLKINKYMKLYWSNEKPAGAASFDAAGGFQPPLTR
jgi:hypothetical protein